MASSRKEQLEDIFKGYGPKTLVSGWSYATVVPSGNAPNTRDQRVSTFKRLGGFDLPTPQSVSRSDQERVWTITRPVESRRRGEARSSKVEKAGLQYPPLGFGATDYLTTHQKSYAAYAPFIFPSPKSLEEEFRPETKFRRKVGDPYDWRRPGLGKFYDDNIAIATDKNHRARASPPPFGLDYQPE